MCGITAIFNIREGASALRQQALEMSKRIRPAARTGAGFIRVKPPSSPTNVFPSSTRLPVANR